MTARTARAPRAAADPLNLTTHNATELSSMDNSVFDRTLSFEDFKTQSGLEFKRPIASKEEGKNCFT